MHGHRDWATRRRIWGAFLLVLGGAWLLGEAGYYNFEWSWAGPIALVVAGLTLLLAPSWGRHCYGYEQGSAPNVEQRLQ